MFDTRDWLACHLQGAAEVTKETWETVAGFVLLWNLFEERLCGKQACIPKFRTLAIQFGTAHLSDEMVAAYAFWEKRYCEAGRTNYLFGELFAREDGMKETAATLLNPKSSENDRLLALLLIVYRLRNNLLHGEKPHQSLNGQQENLDMGARLLATTMEHFGIA